MRRNWKKYNRELVRRGEILIDPEVTAVTFNKQKKREEDLSSTQNN